jgi:hypothetical protein
MGAPAPEETRVVEIVAYEEDSLPPVLRRVEVRFGGGHAMPVASAGVRAVRCLLRQSGPRGIPAVIVARADATRGSQRLAKIGRSCVGGDGSTLQLSVHVDILKRELHA